MLFTTRSISKYYENFKIIFRGKVYWIRAKEVPGWTPDLVEDSDEEELSDDDHRRSGSKKDSSWGLIYVLWKNWESWPKQWANHGWVIEQYCPISLNLKWMASIVDSKNFLSLNIQGPGSTGQKRMAKELCVKNKVNFLSDIKKQKMVELIVSCRGVLGVHVTDVKSGKKDWRSFVALLFRNIDHIHSMDLAQKSKIRMDRFAKPFERRANIDMRFPKTISEDQSQDLEREVSKQEIKTAFWAVGTKTNPPALTVFSLAFIGIFGLLVADVYMAVNHFFIHEKFLLCCNSIIIALIPKVPDARRWSRTLDLLASLK
ncbi:hypothetical protein Tco_0815939 [Tanacetum coccineum]